MPKEQNVKETVPAEKSVKKEQSAEQPTPLQDKELDKVAAGGLGTKQQNETFYKVPLD